MNDTKTLTYIMRHADDYDWDRGQQQIEEVSSELASEISDTFGVSFDGDIGLYTSDTDRAIRTGNGVAEELTGYFTDASVEGVTTTSDLRSGAGGYTARSTLQRQGHDVTICVSHQPVVEQLKRGMASHCDYVEL